MREPPPRVGDADVLRVVQASWEPAADHVEHLPVGFGAHHWRVSSAGARGLFGTQDRLGSHHSAASLESAYAAAAALAAGGLGFVVAPLASRLGGFTVELAGGRLSCAPWLDAPVAGEGPVADDRLARANAAALAQLHTADAPPGTPRWQPRVGTDFVERLERALAEPWIRGPFGAKAHLAIASQLGAIEIWTARYHELVDRARHRPWVPTHGEPHTRNQLVTAAGPVLVDWESLALAPRERDLGPLVASGYADLVAPDWSMMELFDLEWRLDEVSQYAAWFAAEHDGTADDQIAIQDLLAELTRPDFRSLEGLGGRRAEAQRPG